MKKKRDERGARAVFDVITEGDYRKQVDRVAGRAFLFFGEEDYLKKAAVALTREKLCPDPAFAAFNDVTLDALDFTPDKLLDAMTPPPMMADARLIVLRGFDFTAMKQQEIDDLVEVLALLPEYDYNTVIVTVSAGLIDEGFLPKSPGKVLKKLAEVAVPVRFVSPADAKLASWVVRHFAHCGVTVGADVPAALIDYCGKSMFVLANEIEKLAFYALQNGRKTVTSADVPVVAAPASTPDAFALSNAVLAGRSAEALEALYLMKFRRIEPTVVLGEIARTFGDMQNVRLLSDAGKSQAEIAADLHLHAYKVGLILRAVSRTDAARISRAVALAAEADAALKRMGAADYAPIEKLICAL